MLPFLNKNIRQGSGVIVKQREPDQETGNEVSPDTIEDCCKRLLKAIENKSVPAMVEALRDAHDELHLEMNEESNTYDAQNKAAAKDNE